MEVNGAAEAEHLVEMGENIANKILQNLDGMASARTVLDFGVGLGRVLWPLSQKLPSAPYPVPSKDTPITLLFRSCS